MADRPPAAPRRGPLLIAGVCLAIGIILPLLVSTYTRVDPQLWGIPFFYWYQFLLVIITVVLTSIAYRFTLRYEQARRAYEKQKGEI
ncbi:DUF3311 domain-containing protein [Solicola gregarius]|uniref:DUF3311 domain-containing protein n=1 Tax=Solicola gregarius TaxID=2908642 RepID=A0AA46TIS5_9ACTN|nr:DUF3311 domain-containing protein [Solicola gregarius]UYM06025.1 DUF3311 domain-containing protein [Solicola gregarius]